jgi:hypothetical protein
MLSFKVIYGIKRFPITYRAADLILVSLVSSLVLVDVTGVENAN